MNIRPLSVRDKIPAVTFSHEYDEDDRKHIAVSYVVVDENDVPVVPHGMSYEECLSMISVEV